MKNVLVSKKSKNFKFNSESVTLTLEFNQEAYADLMVMSSVKPGEWFLNIDYNNTLLRELSYDGVIDSDTLAEIITTYEYIERNISEGITSVDKVQLYMNEFQRASRKILKGADSEETQKPEPTLKPKLKATGTPRTAGSLEEQIWDIVHQSFETEESQEVITQTIKDKLDGWGIVPNQTEVVIKEAGKESRNVGKQHKQFAEILQCIKAGVNVALVGPAGSGKTTAVREVAKALELKFYSKSVSAQTGTHEFFGYQDATGNYVRTIFRDAFENGGVFLLDEFDAGNPNVLAALNQATANGQCSFADGMVKKHNDFIVVMAGNTFGFGATTEYVGRNKIDAATLDRFAFINFEYDEEFELTLTSNQDWAKKVQKLRKVASDKKIRTIISPRATINGAKLLSAGMTEDKVLEVIVFKGLEKTEVDMLKTAI